MKVRNKQTGIISDFTANDARWLVDSGICEYVVDTPVDKPVAIAPAIDEPVTIKQKTRRNKKQYKTKVLTAETVANVAIQAETTTEELTEPE